ncbi:MAG: carbohydrate kinase [Spirochaetota bacterium]|nr:carbohydrate kinase [Spirochaetota bacterium]
MTRKSRACLKFFCIFDAYFLLYFYSMILIIGEILFDIFSDYKRLGGAPFNFSFHLKNLGMPVRFITRVGNDIDGKEISTYLQKNGFEISDLQIDPDHASGRVLIELDNLGMPEFNILPNAAYDHISFDDSIKSLINEKVGLIYFGSLIQRSKNGHRTLQKLLSQKKINTKCFYDVNLRPKCYTKAIVIESLEHSDILKLNEEELIEIKDMFEFQGDEHNFIRFLIQKYSFDMIAVTRGSRGSSLYIDDNEYTIELSDTKDIIDTVGAGDAFSAILAIGYLKGWEPNTILSVASTFALQICKIKGAVPSDINFYRDISTMITKI